MKHRSLLTGMPITSVLLAFVSCSETENDLTDSIEGTYYGTFTRSFSLKSAKPAIDGLASGTAEVTMMGDIGDDETEWMHHLHDEHEEGDEHFGSFDMHSGTFNYSIRMTDEIGPYYMRFSGSKEQ